MVRPIKEKGIREKYGLDGDGSLRLAMKALLVIMEPRLILMDPGAADFLPRRLALEYGLERSGSLEDQLADAGIGIGQITDVIFTHLHFDHGSGAFRRVPGNIVKRFPEARYHVLKEHYDYALNPESSEANSFFTPFLKRLDTVHWLERWDDDRIGFKVYQGHTRGMVVPVIKTDGMDTCYMTDLIPMEIFLQAGVYSGYDLEPHLADQEKLDFLEGLHEPVRLIFFHEPLKDWILYP